MTKSALSNAFSMPTPVKITGRTSSITNIELCVLQIRKILELIALSSLVSDEDLHREKMRNVRNVIRDAECIHPDFYSPIQSRLISIGTKVNLTSL